MKNALKVLLISVLLSSCNKYPNEVNTSLELSGKNRIELERVLEHYRAIGGKKYEAACFLISNMQYHKSNNTIILDNSYNSFFSKTDSIYNIIFNDIPIKDILSYKPKDYDSIRVLRKSEFDALPSPLIKDSSSSDLHIIKADFLIDNIDKAFDEWENNPLLKGMSFDDFKEFVLPYRTTNEELLFKRSEMANIWKERLSKDGYSNITYPIERYKVYVDKCRWINHHIKATEHLAMYDLFLPKFKMDCHNMTNWSCNILRSVGIPTVYEYTPQWKDRISRHFWCVSPDSAGIWMPYTAPDNNIKEDWVSDIKYAGKIYRRTFAANKKSPYFLSSKFECIPEELSTPLISDQTWRYNETITLRIPFNENTENKLAYLCMFKGEELNPIAWGIIDKENKEVVYEQVPINTVFIPAYYEDEFIIPYGTPFIIYSADTQGLISKPLTTNHQKNIYEFRINNNELKATNNNIASNLDLKYIQIFPNNKRIGKMTVLRKYPEKRRLKELQEKLKGAVFTGSNEEKENYDTLFTLNKAPIPYLQEINLNNKKAYRYYRFFSSGKVPVNIAHMEFLGPLSRSHKCERPTALPKLPNKDNTSEDNLYRIDGIPLKTGSKPEIAFDGDFETFVGSSGIGMDFGKPVLITHVRFIPRNANNSITIGDTYQLLYHNGKEWVRFKTLKAEYNYLEFNDVPEGTLYWLRNQTNGKEEHPFFYKNDKQFFMNLDFPFSN